MPPVAGVLKDASGPTMPILFALLLVAVTIALMSGFALERRRRPAIA